MIKRHYFMKVKKLHGDGAGSYSYQTLTFVHKSWLPHPQYVFDDAFKKMKELMSDKPGEVYEVCSFNRI
jgi:hypothetical protein